MNILKKLKVNNKKYGKHIMALVIMALMLVVSGFITDMKEVQAADNAKVIMLKKSKLKAAVPDSAKNIVFISKKDIRSDISAKIDKLTGTDISIDGDSSICVYLVGDTYYVVSMNNAIMAIDECDMLFKYYSQLETVEFRNFDIRYVESMSYMFERCQSLKKIDLSGLDTRYVTDMYGMFSNCYDLTEVNLSGLNTKNVDSFVYMFSECSNLKELDLSSFNTGSARKMYQILTECLKIAVH